MNLFSETFGNTILIIFAIYIILAIISQKIYYNIVRKKGKLEDKLYELDKKLREKKEK